MPTGLLTASCCAPNQCYHSLACLVVLVAHDILKEKVLPASDAVPGTILISHPHQQAGLRLFG